MTYTHTYVIMEIPRPMWEEIKRRLLAANYDDQIDGNELNMHGIALVPSDET